MSFLVIALFFKASNVTFTFFLFKRSNLSKSLVTSRVSVIKLILDRLQRSVNTSLDFCLQIVTCISSGRLLLLLLLLVVRITTGIRVGVLILISHFISFEYNS